MEQVSVFDKLRRAYYDKFWQEYLDDRERIERSIRKFCYVRGMDRDDTEDFITHVMIVCAQSYPEYDSKRASLMTWIIWKARGCMRDYIRSVVRDPITFSDTERDNARSVEDTAGGDLDSQRLEFVLNREIQLYRQSLIETNELRLLNVLDLMIQLGPDCTTREIASLMGVSHVTIFRLRNVVYGELRGRVEKAL